jgi:hypothetical protein
MLYGPREVGEKRRKEGGKENLVLPPDVAQPPLGSSKEGHCREGFCKLATGRRAGSAAR